MIPTEDRGAPTEALWISLMPNGYAYRVFDRNVIGAFKRGGDLTDLGWFEATAGTGHVVRINPAFITQAYMGPIA